MLASREAEYQPAGFIDLIAPKPLLILAAIKDALIPIDQVRAAFAGALGDRRSPARRRSLRFLSGWSVP